MALEALGYVLLHLAKAKVAHKEEFQGIFGMTGLRGEFMEPLWSVVMSHIDNLRTLLNQDNQKGLLKYNAIDWRLSMVSGTRQKQKMMIPKYTVKLDLEHMPTTGNFDDAVAHHDSKVFDCDYHMMKRIQEELHDAVKSVESHYTKKV